MRTLILALLIAGVARADTTTADPPALVAGLGAKTCEDFTRQSELLEAQGHMSGLNEAALLLNLSRRNLGGMPVDAQLKAVRDFCAAYPHSQYFEAADFLYDELPTPQTRYSAVDGKTIDGRTD
jgi:hypothetical protein